MFGISRAPKIEGRTLCGSGLGVILVGQFLVAGFISAVGSAPDNGGFFAAGEVAGLDIVDREAGGPKAATVVTGKAGGGADGLHV